MDALRNLGYSNAWKNAKLAECKTKWKLEYIWVDGWMQESINILETNSCEYGLRDSIFSEGVDR